MILSQKQQFHVLKYDMDMPESAKSIIFDVKIGLDKLKEVILCIATV